jgi:hypothetical protein
MARFFGILTRLSSFSRETLTTRAISQADLVTTEFNVLELTYALFRDFGRDEAANVITFIRFKIEIVPTEDSDYLNASEFMPSANRTGKKLSLVEALGYSYSRKLGIKFLTGDKEFIEMENVEYVK